MRLRRFFFSPDGAGGAAPAPAPAGGDGGTGNAAPTAPAGGANPAGAAPQQAPRKLSARLTERFGELAAPEQPKIVKAADGSIDVDGYNSSMKSYTEGLERYNRATKFRQGISELLDNGLTHEGLHIPFEDGDLDALEKALQDPGMVMRAVAFDRGMKLAREAGGRDYEAGLKKGSGQTQTQTQTQTKDPVIPKVGAEPAPSDYSIEAILKRDAGISMADLHTKGTQQLFDPVDIKTKK